jgi:glycosyltransferase involved in cell wall biosynthesis
VVDSEVRFGITIATYQRPDGSTNSLLNRALQSVYNQTYHNWKLFLIGDNYHDRIEFGAIVARAGYHCGDDFQSVNLPYAIGRDTGLKEIELWKVGGVGAMNFALTLQHIDGIDVHCHLDDDDYWLPDHLETLSQEYADPYVAFVYTQAKRTYKDDVYPKCTVADKRPWRPRANGLIHSTASWKLSDIDSMYIPKLDQPADSYLWTRIADELDIKKLNSVFVPKVTVVRESSMRMVNYGEKV